MSQRFLEAEGRYNYTTPKSFLELIEFYKDLLRKHQGELGRNIGRLANGLKTLRKTNDDVQVQHVSQQLNVRIQRPPGLNPASKPRATTVFRLLDQRLDDQSLQAELSVVMENPYSSHSSW